MGNGFGSLNHEVHGMNPWDVFLMYKLVSGDAFLNYIIHSKGTL